VQSLIRGDGGIEQFARALQGGIPGARRNTSLYNNEHPSRIAFRLLADTTYKRAHDIVPYFNPLSIFFLSGHQYLKNRVMSSVNIKRGAS